MPRTEGTERTARDLGVAGTWLATASLLMIAALLFHGPIAPDIDDQMVRIADAAVRWSIVHWMAAAALSLYAVSGLVVLSSRSRLTGGWWTLTAWAVVPVSALWTTITAVAETTVVAEAAISGRTETFRAWWAFAEGKGSGFALMALAIAVIAGSEARNPHRTGPTWPAWLGTVAGAASFTGWALGSWIGIGFGNLLWVASSILMCAWIFWFGLGLTGLVGPGRPGR